MNERIIPEPSEQKLSSKLVPFPVPPPIASPVKGKVSSRRHWLVAAAAALFVAAVAVAA